MRATQPLFIDDSYHFLLRRPLHGFLTGQWRVDLAKEVNDPVTHLELRHNLYASNPVTTQIVTRPAYASVLSSAHGTLTPSHWCQCRRPHRDDHTSARPASVQRVALTRCPQHCGHAGFIGANSNAS